MVFKSTQLYPKTAQGRILSALSIILIASNGLNVVPGTVHIEHNITRIELIIHGPNVEEPITIVVDNNGNLVDDNSNRLNSNPSDAVEASDGTVLDGILDGDLPPFQEADWLHEPIPGENDMYSDDFHI